MGEAISITYNPNTISMLFTLRSPELCTLSSLLCTLRHTALPLKALPLKALLALQMTSDTVPTFLATTLIT